MSNNNINEKTLSPIIIDKVTCCYLLHVLLVVQSERCSRIKKNVLYQISAKHPPEFKHLKILAGSSFNNISDWSFY